MFFQLKPQFHSDLIAVRQEVNLRLLAVNCCPPARKPMLLFSLAVIG
jgi:hypothetical protein